MLFVTKDDIDGLCQYGEILNIADIAEIVGKAHDINIIACESRVHAEQWSEFLREESAKRAAK